MSVSTKVLLCYYATWVVSCPVYRFHSECNVSDTAEYTYQRQPAQPVARTRARQSQLRQPELSDVDQVEPETCKMCVKLYFNTLASTTTYISWFHEETAAVSPTPALDNALITRIVSEVTQAVVASFSHQHQPASASSVEPTTTREVALGGIPVVDATVQGPVASAMENLTGEHVNLGGSCPHFLDLSISIQ